MACAHRGCTCAETPVRRGGASYCSERCAGLQESGKHEPRCPCGHPGCGSPKKTT